MSRITVSAYLFQFLRRPPSSQPSAKQTARPLVAQLFRIHSNAIMDFDYKNQKEL